MKFRTKIEITAFKEKIEYNNLIFFIGSCFSSNIGNECSRNGLTTLINPFGTTYNPLSIIKILYSIDKGENLESEDLRKVGDKWCSMMHNSDFDSNTKEELISATEKSIKNAKRFLENTSHVFITLGTAWVYEERTTGRCVNNCHKIADKEFIRRKLSVEEIVNNFSELIESTQILKDKKLVFTVSPIRHIKDSLIGNSVSKATLITAVNELCEKYPNQISYFPAYEIMMDDLRDYRFYNDDLVHISPLAVDYIFSHFKTTFFTSKTLDFGSRMVKISQAMEHKVLNKDGEEYLKFKKVMLNKLVSIKNEFILANLEEKINHFK